MRRFDDDPEVIAERRARDRYAGADRDEGKNYAGATFRPPAIVAGWACRARCGRFVPVTDAAVAARETSNAKLRDRGEREVGEDEIVFCGPCIRRAAPDRGEAKRRQIDEMAALIRELKTLVDNDLRERAVVARIRQLGHPDVDGLLRAVRDGRKKPGAPGGRSDL